jgi:hypothetical protein
MIADVPGFPVNKGRWFFGNMREALTFTKRTFSTMDRSSLLYYKILSDGTKRDPSGSAPYEPREDLRGRRWIERLYPETPSAPIRRSCGNPSALGSAPPNNRVESNRRPASRFGTCRRGSMDYGGRVSPSPAPVAHAKCSLGAPRTFSNTRVNDNFYERPLCDPSFHLRRCPHHCFIRHLSQNQRAGRCGRAGPDCRDHDRSIAP